MKKNSIDLVKRCYPFFWKECECCGLFFKLEVGFKVTRKLFNQVQTKYICTSCTPTLESAECTVNRWPDSLPRNCGYQPHRNNRLDLKNPKKWSCSIAFLPKPQKLFFFCTLLFLRVYRSVVF